MEKTKLDRINELAPLAEARRFSRRFDFPLIEIEGADHRFQDPAKMDFAIARILDFFGLR